MAKPRKFSELRARMSAESLARAEAQGQAMLSAGGSANEPCPACELSSQGQVIHETRAGEPSQDGERGGNRRKRLRDVEVLPGLCLRLTFMDASVHTVNFTPLLDKSPGLAPLADEQAFAQARLLEGEGWAVV